LDEANHTRHAKSQWRCHHSCADNEDRNAHSVPAPAPIIA
jgi:hypothetical protein